MPTGSNTAKSMQAGAQVPPMMSPSMSPEQYVNYKKIDSQIPEPFMSAKQDVGAPL
jgi:hypothetical protein